MQSKWHAKIIRASRSTRGDDDSIYPPFRLPPQPPTPLDSSEPETVAGRLDPVSPMALATTHHRCCLVPAAPAASRLPRGFLCLRASPSPLLAARSAFCYHLSRICCQCINSADVLGASSAMKALKDLGLDVTKGNVAAESAVTQTKFHIMRSGRKVEDPDMLEKIRLTIINNLLKYHPESSENLAMGEFFGVKSPEKKASIVDIDVATHVHVEDDGPKRSMLYIETADRPGLLLEIIKIINDTNVDVESAEIDTEGLVAKDKFHVSYRGAKLNSSLSQVLTNSLRYYLRRPETDEDSY
ncbi:hypothetical protein PR202_gb00507 [Eleusine coracana subsp. coracana]|uniref:ACT domain-containing protein ACR n=1 Tax=Eleusine coracana subsp. coracana TaxID=191504 RepID=A0AAV5DV09_ELECO|nr:hypothetical protein PR202_gb00507 [Eleusine coracana subsp. coracana]